MNGVVKPIFLLLLLLVSILVLRAQDTTSSSKWEGQYFKYTATKKSIGVSPLFASSPVSDSSMLFAEVDFLNKDYTNRNWTEFTTIFVEQVLKKHLTIDEIRLLKNETGYVTARMLFYFNYSGDILYTTFVFRKQVARILTEEKLYAIYQDLMKLKVDTEGKTADKRHRYQPEVIKGYQKAVFLLSVANRIEDLFRNHSLNYEVLQGNKKGISSVRINKKYRLEFTVREELNEKIITCCRLLDISNHYK